jgi:hypothetical protein
VTFEINSRVRCRCPEHIADPGERDGRIARVVEGLEKRLVGVAYRHCYVVEVDGVRYNALPEWLALDSTARAQSTGKNMDEFLGVTGKL